MAKRGATRRIESALGLFGLVAVGVTVSIVLQWNPWPGIRDWFLSHRGNLSDPATAWSERVANQPKSAALTDRAVLVFMGDLVESRARTDGTLLWQKEVDWAALGGADATTVAVLSKVDGKGFDAVDPYSGQQRWTDHDATGVWTFRDAVLAIECPSKSGCALANRAPADGAVRWRIPLAGTVRALAGANEKLLGLRGVDDNLDDAKAAAPRPMPRFLGFTIDGKLQVIDTTAGQRLREENINNQTRVALVGNRIVSSSATTNNGSCRYTVQGRDAAGGQQVWRIDGYDMHTAGGAGCEPRRSPSGGGVVLIGARGDYREVFLSAVDGRELAATAQGEKIEGTDGEYGFVRAADGKSIRAVNLSKGGAAAWTRQIPTKARVSLTPYGLFIVDLTVERLTTVDVATGQVKLDVNTGNTVLGIHPDGVVLARGRNIGYLAFGTVYTGT